VPVSLVSRLPPGAAAAGREQLSTSEPGGRCLALDPGRGGWVPGCTAGGRAELAAGRTGFVVGDNIVAVAYIAGAGTELIVGVAVGSTGAAGRIAAEAEP